MSEEVEVEGAVGAEGAVAVEEKGGEETFVDYMLSKIDNDEVKGAGFWKNLAGKDANEVGSYIKELHGFAGTKGDIPKKDAADEEWDSFHKKLGRPDSVEGYDFNMADDFKESIGEDAVPFFQKAIEGFKEQAFKMGASSEKAEGLVSWYLDMVSGDIKASNEELAKGEAERDTELRNEWGEGYDSMMSGVKALLKNNGMADENIQFAEESGLLRDPALATTLARIAAKFGDDPEIGHHQTNTMAGVKDQLFDVNEEIKGFIRSGTTIPTHIQEKRADLMGKLGENL